MKVYFSDEPKAKEFDETDIVMQGIAPPNGATPASPQHRVSAQRQGAGFSAKRQTLTSPHETNRS